MAYRKPKNVNLFLIVLSSVCWGALLLVGLLEQQHLIYDVEKWVLFLLKGTALNSYIISVYILVQRFVGKRAADFPSIISYIFFAGLYCTFLSGIATIMLMLVDRSVLIDDTFWHTIVFHIEFGLLIIVLLYALASWKYLILHEKNRFSHYVWQIFEWLLALSLIGHFFPNHYDAWSLIPLVLLAIIIFPLLTQVRWIAVFSFNQKLISLGQLLVFVACMVYFLFSMQFYFLKEPLMVDEVSKSLFSIATSAFVSAYTLSAMLVLLFNLPTSSVFERKFNEMALFEEMSDTILEGEDERGIYEILFENAITTARAEAGWITAGNWQVFIGKRAEQGAAKRFMGFLADQGYSGVSARKLNQTAYLQESEHGNDSRQYESVLAFPVGHDEHTNGHMVLLHKLPNAFDKMILSAVGVFVGQANIALYNQRLLAKVVENERLTNELKIAREVQQRLLPRSSGDSRNISFMAKAESATEVGGDYHDFYYFKDGRYSIVVADVAGHGISAAFNMAQMKGIFQALIRLGLSTETLTAKANMALANCLEKSSFITAVFYEIDTQKKTLKYTRAGHCPGFYYQKQTATVFQHNAKGLGLGIIRTEKFDTFIQEHEMPYAAGDVLLLYTDGLVENKAEDGEEFGYQRLEKSFCEHLQKPLSKALDSITADVHQFSGTQHITDDFTLFMVKF